MKKPKTKHPRDNRPKEMECPDCDGTGEEQMPCGPDDTDCEMCGGSGRVMRPAKKEDYWPCACVIRDRNGVLKAIKLNHPQVLKCLICKCTKPERG